MNRLPVVLFTHTATYLTIDDLTELRQVNRAALALCATKQVKAVAMRDRCRTCRTFFGTPAHGMLCSVCWHMIGRAAVADEKTSLATCPISISAHHALRSKVVSDGEMKDIIELDREIITSYLRRGKTESTISDIIWQVTSDGPFMTAAQVSQRFECIYRLLRPKGSWRADDHTICDGWTRLCSLMVDPHNFDPSMKWDGMDGCLITTVCQRQCQFIDVDILHVMKSLTHIGDPALRAIVALRQHISTQ